ncbi:hypothetical protein E2C00_24605 [Streptomyces sp. WAC05374]|uniref:hypothetical protein n=1 Tax=Streptomyces sp. WAC05374 TaxID=2487420 RepID=UPI000F8775B2|nr:hypothetical protein [Streptomyces sp. WAC05374]RST18868.1 hypothetical protein EF905_03495 [Streptomyces sp. WAC05374]TDF43877.1 hypothetical protein E2B92_18165 [Streptomyces sp. WAC05374]TDF51956.1 hypothetical protein E2C00_24605 [Streptomyces sp. WAC05374]TDF54311.1 hypothetical protein E2C02_17000 [Streptomyces sp. WAC05374]
MHPFHLFALQLADRLPGTWTALYRQYTRAADQFADTYRVWTPLDARPAIAFRSHGITLRRHDDLELYIVEHRRGRVLVCPVIPQGLHEGITDRIPAPPTVAGPLDPARAAWRITDRILPHYTAAVTGAREATAALAARRSFVPALLPVPQPDISRARAR